MPRCFKEIIRRGIYTCSRVLWFRKPQRDPASVRFQYCVHCSCVECEFSFMRYSAVQRIFICNTFMKKSSWRKCRRKFRRQFPDSSVPDKTTIYRLVKKFNYTGSVQNKKPQVNKRVLTEEKLDEIGFRLEQSPKKSLRRLAQQVGVSKSSVQLAT